MMNMILNVLGILLAVSGAILMIEGNIIGEKTKPTAIVLGIIGICLIATYSPRKIRKI